MLHAAVVAAIQPWADLGPFSPRFAELGELWPAGWPRGAGAHYPNGVGWWAREPVGKPCLVRLGALTFEVDVRCDLLLQVAGVDTLALAYVASPHTRGHPWSPVDQLSRPWVSVNQLSHLRMSMG